jgi:hypothetical protein
MYKSQATIMFATWIPALAAIALTYHAKSTKNGHSCHTRNVVVMVAQPVAQK